MCVDYRYRTESLQNIELETEDEAYRAIDGIGILLEIRAFDATYFEVYLNDKLIADKLYNHFNFSNCEEISV